MERIEVKEWMAINRTIYKIYGDEDLHTMQSDFLENLNMFIDFDSAYFYLAKDEEGLVFNSPAVFQCEADDEIDFSSVPEISEIIQNKKTIVFRETDISRSDLWRNTLNYHLFYKPNNWYYGMRLVIALDNKVLGTITLFRGISKKNFDINDVLVLDLFKEHLALRLSSEKKQKNRICAASTLEYDKMAQKYDLTRKERIILEMLSKGEASEQISSELDVSVNTVKKHTVNIYRKLGINKRIQLIQMFAN